MDAPIPQERAARRRRAGLIVVATGGLLLAVGLLLTRGTSGPSENGPQEARPAPAIRLADLSGQEVTLSRYRGKVVLLDFWATWCATCVEEMPGLLTLYPKLRPRGFELLAASLDEGGRKTLMPFVATYSIPWPVLIANEDATRTYAVFGLPTKYLIDRNGVLVRRYIGAVDVAELERDIQTLIDKKETSSS